MNSLLLATLLVVTDPHVLAPELHDNGAAFLKYAQTGSGRDLEDSTALWDAFLETALREKPRAVLVTGDLTNQGEKASHLLLAAGLERLRQAGIRPLVVPGNHDLNNPYARAFQGDKQVETDPVTPEEFVEIYGRYGYDDALDRDRDSLSYLAQVTPTQWVLMLDSAVYESNGLLGYPENRGVFTDHSLAWVAQCGQRARAAGARLVAAMHHSLADHSAVITEGYTVDNAVEVARALAGAGVRLVLTGHIHIQDISQRTLAEGTVYDVATNALSVFPNHYGRLDWSGDSGALVYQSASVTVPGSPLEARARAVFRAGATRLFSKEGRDLMAVLNENYFAGREDLNQVLAQTPEFHRLEAAGGFLGPYVKSMVTDFDTLPDNHLELR